MDLSKTALKIVKTLDKTYPDAPATYLNYQNPFEMLIATILSARATDAGVNKISPALFKKYPTPEKMAKANLEEIGQIIRPLGAFNKKAGYITGTSTLLVANFGGEVPKTMRYICFVHKGKGFAFIGTADTDCFQEANQAFFEPFFRSITFE